MATVYKIHPAIGIARLGNSPEEHFIGPERVGEKPEPAGGFKDAQCRVKRQAARFRIFAHHDDGSFEEINATQAEITWTVRLVNKKASHPDRGNDPSGDLIIDPGARSCSAPNQSALFDTGTIRFVGAPAVTVPLGEMRTDNENRLLVLGGFGAAASPLNTAVDTFWRNPEWYDDAADGPVTATIRLRSDNSTPAVAGAWVISAPPKFAPQLDNVITLYDRVFDVMTSDPRLQVPKPTATSYTADVQPILQRARDARWVKGMGTGPHAWADPVYTDELRSKIFSRITKPDATEPDMPPFYEGDDPTGRLTETQYRHMERWRSNDFAKDWTALPPVGELSPSGLDRAALEACVGGAFYPGIEAGGRSPDDRPITDPTSYSEAFRLNHAVLEAGDVTRPMALPWQADFWDCAYNWWPVPRPDRVFPEGASAPVNWTRDFDDHEDMVEKWHTLGFVVRQGSQYVEVQRCETPSITLLTPELDFRDVPLGPLDMPRETVLPIELEVSSQSAAVTLEYAPGGAPRHPQLEAYNPSVRIEPSTVPTIARLFVIYRTGAEGSVLPPQSVVVRVAGTTQDFVVSILGNTVARRPSATALVLDRSISMAADRGDGESKHDAQRRAALAFTELMLPGDGLAVVRFNQDAQALQPVLQLGDSTGADANRDATLALLRGTSFEPNGRCSIGDGLFEAQKALAAAADGYARRTIVVATDGRETSPRSIAEVAPEIDASVYALGMGRPHNISVPALLELASNNAGYLLLTGAVERDDRFLLHQKLLQVLAEINGSEVALERAGRLRGRAVERIPFRVTDADGGLDVILLCNDVDDVDFRLQTPNGFILEPWRALAERSMRYLSGQELACYRLTLPAELLAGRIDRAGTWHVLLKIGKPQLEQSDSPEGTDRTILRNLYRSTPRARALPLDDAQSLAAPSKSIAYNLIVHSYSGITLRASAQQSGYEPGARVRIDASLSELGLPTAPGAQVSVEVDRPRGGDVTLSLQETEPGRFQGELETNTSGLYRIRLLARGNTRLGQKFTREQRLMAAVWRGQPSERVLDVHAQEPRGPRTEG